MIFPADIVPDGDQWMVSFPDIPEALTGAATRDEAVDLARDALVTALEFYFDDRREVPLPSRVRKGQEGIALPVSVAAKVLLLNEMIRQQVRPSELARRMGTSAQDINRLTPLRHATKIDGIALALQALGKRIEVRVV